MADRRHLGPLTGRHVALMTATIMAPHLKVTPLGYLEAPARLMPNAIDLALMICEEVGLLVDAGREMIDG